MSNFIELNEADNIDIDLSEIKAVKFPVEGEEVVIDPKTEEQEIVPSSADKLISKAFVKAVTSEIDANIVPENIKLGARILGVDGNLAPDKPDQTKTTTPSKERQIIRADAGYELVENIVEPIPEDYVKVAGELEITENNKVYDVKNYETAKVEIADKPAGDYFIKVVDYDGELLDEVWLNTGETYTLPTTAPEHDRLTFQEWSATQDIVDGQITITNNDVMVGAVYTTKSGLSEFDIEITKAMVADIETNGFTVTLNMNGNKYWDYNNDKVTSDTTTTHTYYAYGKYTIACDGTTMSTSSGGGIVGQTSTNSYRYLLTNCHIVGVSKITSYAFSQCRALETVTIDNGTTTTADTCFSYTFALRGCVFPKTDNAVAQPSVFYNCYNLKSVVWADRLGTNFYYGCLSLQNVAISVKRGFSITNSEFRECASLKRICYPEPINIPTYCFADCYNLEEVLIPIRYMGQYAFQRNYKQKVFDFPDLEHINSTHVINNCKNLERVNIGAKITLITDQAFGTLDNLKIVDLTAIEQIPRLDGSRAFGTLSSLNQQLKIVVPDRFYDEIIVATNWSALADYIYKASEVEL